MVCDNLPTGFVLFATVASWFWPVRYDRFCDGTGNPTYAVLLSMAAPGQSSLAVAGEADLSFVPLALRR
jgi:hypothetical protein